MRSHWIKVGLKSNDGYSYHIEAHVKTQTHKEDTHICDTEKKAGVMPLYVKKGQGLLATTKK